MGTELINKKIVIYTCIYGDYDNIKDSCKQDIECDFVCLTDNENLKSSTWQIIKFEPLNYFKNKADVNPVNYNVVNTVLCRSDLRLLEPLKKYDICIYIDANAIIIKSDVISNILNSNNTNDYNLIISKHPFNLSIYEEVHLSKTIHKYHNTDFDKQLKKYKQENYKDIGLFWNGFIFYLTPFSNQMDSFYNTYTEEFMIYAKDDSKYYHPQGQVSLPYVLWKTNIKYISINNYYASENINITPHNK